MIINREEVSRTARWKRQQQGAGGEPAVGVRVDAPGPVWSPAVTAP